MHTQIQTFILSGSTLVLSISDIQINESDLDLIGQFNYYSFEAKNLLLHNIHFKSLKSIN